MIECHIADCDRPTARAGLCWRHYEQTIRPKLPRKRKHRSRTATVRVCLSPQDRADVEAAAARAGLALSAWIGELIEDTLRMEREDCA